ncbi:uncharacterized protein Dmul_04910 [Desulfococcus multivorans]|nr:uncharacterized protein Dmul_04910 [Desulfococcus multivorans]
MLLMLAVRILGIFNRLTDNEREDVLIINDSTMKSDTIQRSKRRYIEIFCDSHTPTISWDLERSRPERYPGSLALAGRH